MTVLGCCFAAGVVIVSEYNGHQFVDGIPTSLKKRFKFGNDDCKPYAPLMSAVMKIMYVAAIVLCTQYFVGIPLWHLGGILVGRYVPKVADSMNMTTEGKSFAAMLTAAIGCWVRTSSMPIFLFISGLNSGWLLREVSQVSLEFKVKTLFI